MQREGDSSGPLPHRHSARRPIVDSQRLASPFIDLHRVTGIDGHHHSRSRAIRGLLGGSALEAGVGGQVDRECGAKHLLSS